MWYFRIIVPRDLHAAFGKKVIKRSLGTREPGIAKAYAYTLGAQHAHAIAQAWEEQRMGSQRQKDGPAVSRFDIKRHDDGNYSVSTNGTSQDNAAALRALEILTAAQPLPQPTVTKPSFNGPTLYQAVEIFSGKAAVANCPSCGFRQSRKMAGPRALPLPGTLSAH